MNQVAVVGLGYVGLPIAIAFSRHARVIGFDTDSGRVRELRGGVDRTGQVDSSELSGEIEFTDDSNTLRRSDFTIVAVPTPLTAANRPALSALERATETVGRNLTRGAIVVFESTVYPGATEEVCIPILERESGMLAGQGFLVGYSPERINPGDHEHSFTKICKVIAGQTPEALDALEKMYGLVVEAGVHRAPSIRVAEAAKVIENTQRDLNIALMNELALICSRIGIDTRDVLDAAATKWNFLRFDPGLVGGHCISVDPYYLTHKAEEMGYQPQVILAGRRINDGMPSFVADEVVRDLIRSGRSPSAARITILGLTFKEDVADLRNSGVLRMVKRFREYGIEPQVSDPIARGDDAAGLGVEIVGEQQLQRADALVFAVAHRVYRERGWGLVESLLDERSASVFDIRAVLDRGCRPAHVRLWRL